MHDNGPPSLSWPTFRFVAAVVLLVMASCAAEAKLDKPTRAQCQAARAHEAKLAIAAASSPADDDRTKAELAKHQANLGEVGGDEAITRCEQSETLESITCVMSAKTQAEVVRCRSGVAGP
jgi:hypothetical protein